MPEMDGVEATLELLKDWKEAKILVLTSYLDNEKIYPVIEAGAKGYMLKTSSAAEILNAIQKVTVFIFCSDDFFSQENIFFVALSNVLMSWSYLGVLTSLLIGTPAK